MTLFRKIYKQANDDIKPSEDMINRVILNAHKGAEKRQSPLPYRRYAKYAVSAAAARYRKESFGWYKNVIASNGEDLNG